LKNERKKVGEMIDLTAKIVAAYVSKNTMATADLGEFIKSVYSAMVATSSPEAAAVPQAAPAVSVKKSVTPAELTCMDCGKKLSMLKRHLRTDHSMSPEDYRSKWGLPATYPMVAPDYAERRSQLALKIGLGRKPAPVAVDAEKPKRGSRKVVK